MTSQKRKVTVAVLIALVGATFASADVWQRFNSSNSFSVAYPGTWFRIGASADRIQLLSSKGGAEGIVIKRGQAEITALEGKGSPTKTLTQVISHYTKGSSVLLRRSVHNAAGNEGCSDLKEIISKEEPVPSIDTPSRMLRIVNTDFFCELDGHKIVILLRNWEGDNRQKEYQRVALQMAKSIRLIQR
jgi:hypothetical protein